MTEFALAVTKNCCTSLVPVSKKGDEFLVAIAGKLFPNSPIEEIFVLNVDGKDIDSLMLDAQKLVVESSKFAETELCRTLSKVAPVVDDLVFWYGSDYEDLDYVYDVSALLSKVEEAVSESACELYVHYKVAK